MLVEKMTMPAFERGLNATKTAVIPFGSVEEHGLHLPLGTDTIHAYELAREAGRQYPLFVTPPVWYGLCRSTGCHPGTISITGGTVRRLGVEIVMSLYRQGLRNFVLLSGHAGGTHVAALTDAGEEILETTEDARIAVLSILDLVAAIPGDIVETEGDSHAGEVETSLMQHLRASWVNGTSPAEYPSFSSPILARNKKKFWPGGVWGDPSKASSQKGEVILKREAELLVELVRKLEKFKD
ncbi:MAG TPA: creatininase family protein [Thermodesulfobacteriaceae bacterium]|nr:creatininase family protein [Thermodesulfobacteriaceae bacterium]